MILSSQTGKSGVFHAGASRDSHFPPTSRRLLSSPASVLDPRLYEVPSLVSVVLDPNDPSSAPPLFYGEPLTHREPITQVQTGRF